MTFWYIFWMAFRMTVRVQATTPLGVVGADDIARWLGTRTCWILLTTIHGLFVPNVTEPIVWWLKVLCRFRRRFKKSPLRYVVDCT
jgi:hypothetical protein